LKRNAKFIFGKLQGKSNGHSSLKIQNLKLGFVTAVYLLLGPCPLQGSLLTPAKQCSVWCQEKGSGANRKILRNKRKAKDSYKSFELDF
jgi:hypothetical protein